MAKVEDTKKASKAPKQDEVYETSETVTKHNPYDTKVGGKPVATLADGTVPVTVTSTSNKA